MQWSIRWSHCTGQVPGFLLMFMDWVISETCSHTVLSLHCIVNPAFSCQIPLVSTANWLTTTPVISAPRRACWLSIWIVLASAMTVFGNQKESHYISGSQWWLTIQWWISNAHYSKQASGVFNIVSRVKRCSSRSEEGVLKVREIQSMVGRLREPISAQAEVILIRWHHLGCYSARKPFAYHHLCALIRQLIA